MNFFKLFLYICIFLLSAFIRKNIIEKSGENVVIKTAILFIVVFLVLINVSLYL